MIKYVLENPAEVDKTIKLWLELDEETGTVDLKASLASGLGGSYYLLMFKTNGTITRAECVSEDLGLQLNTAGSVIINSEDD